MWLCCKGAGFCKSRADELHYYENERESIQQKLQEWSMTDMQGTGHAFVIFKSTWGAANCIKASANGNRHIQATDLKFRVRRAAEPDDLMWENYKVSRGDRNLRIFMVHVLLIVLLLFFTSPLSILSAVTSWVNKIDWLNQFFRSLNGMNEFGGDLLLQYLPTLILLLVSNTLPYGTILLVF